MGRTAAIGWMAVLAALAGCPPHDRPPAPGDAAVGCVDDDGYRAPYGTGAVFWEDQFALAPPGQGLDLDRDGEPDDALNRAWNGLPREMINVALRDSIQADRMTAPLEIAGLCGDDYRGVDPAVTFKLYVGRDADDGRANNWCLDPGCGEVLISPDYLDGDQARYRSSPAPIRDFTLQVAIESIGSIEFDLDLGTPLELHRLNLRAVIGEALTEMRDGLLCGVSPARNLAKMRIPLCAENPTICEFYGIPADRTIAEDLRINGVLPDIDLDGDGLERFDVDANGKVEICYDGDGSILGAKDCMQDPELQDGYSACFTFHAFTATIVGVLP